MCTDVKPSNAPLPAIPAELVAAAEQEHGVHRPPVNSPSWVSRAWRVTGRLTWSNPVVGKELRATSRRKRYYLLRLVYLLALTGFAALTWQGAVTDLMGVGDVVLRISRMPDAGKAIVRQVAWFAFIAAQATMLVLCSTAISGERAARTLPTLLSTPMSYFQVVWGKLMGKLSHVLTLVLCTLPLLGLIRIFGGVPWDFIICTSVLTVGAALMIGSLTVYYSVMYSRPWAAMMLALIALGVLHLILMPISGINYLIMSRFTGGLNVFLVLTNPWYGVWICNNELILPTGLSLWWTLLNLPVMVCFALWMTRRTCSKLRQLAYDKPAGEIEISHINMDPVATLAAMEPLAATAPGEGAIRDEGVPPATDSGVGVSSSVSDCSSLASANTRTQRATVEANANTTFSSIKGSPVYWRETHGSLIANSMLFFLVVVLPAAVLVVTYTFFLLSGAYVYTRSHVAIITVLLGIGLFLSVILATTTIAAERQARTLSVLLTTPLTPWQIVRAKAAAILRRGRAIWLIMLGHMILAVGMLELHPLALLHIAILTTGVAVFVVGMGMLVGSIIRSTTLAVLTTLGILFVLWVLLPTLSISVMNAVESRVSQETRWKVRSAVCQGNPFLQASALVDGAPGHLSKDTGRRRPVTELRDDQTGLRYTVPKRTDETLAYDLATGPDKYVGWQYATTSNITTSAAYALIGLAGLFLASRRIRRQA